MLSELRKARLARDVHEQMKLGDFDLIFLKARLKKKRAEMQGALLNPMGDRLEVEPQLEPVLEAAE